MGTRRYRCIDYYCDVDRMSGFEDPAILPLGSILPLVEKEDEVPEGYEVIAGQTITRAENPVFVETIYSKLSHELEDPYIEKIRLRTLEFFTANGGKIDHDYIKLPIYTPKEASRHTWGDMALPTEMPELQLIIKTERTLTNDG